MNRKNIYGSGYDSVTMYEAIIKEIEAVDSAGMYTCCSIYYQYSQPVYVPPFRSLRTAEEDLKRFGQDVFGIFGTLHNDKFLFALPMLSRRIPYITQRKNEAALVHEYSTFLAEDVARTMRKIIEELGQKCAEFQFKTVSFFFVHEPGDTRKLDSDSHDTKAIIDSLVSGLPYGDAAGYCDTSFSSRESETPSSGTYICVSKGLATFQNDSILADFESAFPAKVKPKIK